MTKPKSGDRVRLTTKGGENTVTGVHRERTPSFYIVRVDGTTADDTFHIHDWKIEVIEPTTLDRVKALKPGAVLQGNQTALLIKAYGSVNGDWAYYYGPISANTSGGSSRMVPEEKVAECIDKHGFEIHFEGI